MTQPRLPLDLKDEERWVGQPPRGWDKPTRTGLVLSGGGLKFAVHAGLYERLEKLAYTETDEPGGPAMADLFDCLVGTSAGSLLAAAIACGFCAEDVWRFSSLFSQASFQPYVLDPNWLGAGSFLLKGDLGYLKGLYRGEAIQRTVSAFFSHNFLIALGQLYETFARQGKPTDGPAFEAALGDLLRSLSTLPLEPLPQLATIPDPAQPHPAHSGATLRVITFQDLNPGMRVPYERFFQTDDPQWREHALAEAEQILAAQRPHAEQYREALAAYYRGRTAAGRYVTRQPTDPRPMLMIIGTDIVTGQKTVFGNFNLFEKELVYGLDESVRAASDKVDYRYINQEGQYSSLPPLLTEALRPTNYLYKYLTNGLPVAWAVRVSLSIPGVFAPASIPYNDSFGIVRTDFFVDGGVTDNYALQVAADWNLGRCQRILGGNIGNLGPRIHNYNVRNAIDVLLRTLLIQGDTNVDANAADRLLEKSAVTTINELTPTDVVHISELVKIPQLLKEGTQLADQFFAAFQDGAGQPVQLAKLFGPVGNYTVFLPRIETYGQPAGSPAPPTPDAPLNCDEMASGSSEIDRIVLKEQMDEAAKEAIKTRRSAQLSKCETNLTPLPVQGPGGWLFGLFGGGGPTTDKVPTTDLINLARLAVLGVLLIFVSLLNVGLWRLVLGAWNSGGLFGAASRWFDSWGYWPLLATVLVTALGHYLIFVRLFIFDFWVAQPAKLVRRGLEIIPGLGLYLLPLVVIEGLPFSSQVWPAWFVPFLIALSSGALLFSLYAVVAFGLSLRQGRQTRAAARLTSNTGPD